jgi:hypothetical protein
MGRKKIAETDKKINVTFSITPNQNKLISDLMKLGIIKNKSRFFRDAIQDSVKKLECIKIELNEAKNKRIMKIDTSKLKG